MRSDRRFWMLVPLLAALAAACPAQASDQTLNIETRAREFTRFGSATLPASLSFHGGIELPSGSDDFGGFSGLEVSSDGTRFLAVSDRGNWLTGSFVYVDDRLSNVSDLRMAPILNSKGQLEERKSRSDAEAVAAWDDKGIDGKVIVGFERRQRVEQFNLGKNGLEAKAERIHSPDALSRGENNAELEALGRFTEGPLKGFVVAISERNHTSRGALRGWLWRKSQTHEFHLTQHEDYVVTGLAILPGGEEIITVERSFVPPISVGMALRRFKVDDLQCRRW